jgi:hypothetical protein
VRLGGTDASIRVVNGTLPWDLSDGELRDLAHEIVPRNVAEPLGVYLFAPSERGALLARRLEFDVFNEAFGDPPELVEAELGAYEDSSLWILVMDHRRVLPAGVMRLIVPSPRGLKSLNDLPRIWGVSAHEAIERSGISLDPLASWDVSGMAIAREYRGRAMQGMVGMGLYQTLTRAALACDVRWLVAIFDLPVFRLIRWKLGLIFAGFKGLTAAPYMGSPASIPAWCDLLEAERLLAAADRYLHEVLFLGQGLESALRPLDLRAAGCLTERRARAAAS